jgi:hypothetical protein
VTSIIVVVLFLGFGVILLVTTFKEQKCFTKDPVTGRRTRDPPESEDEFDEVKKDVEDHEAEVRELEMADKEKAKSKSVATVVPTDTKDCGEKETTPTNREGDLP